MKKLFKNYINTFKGLSKEIWWLALMTLINRAGTMVIPFLTIYLKKSLEFSLSDIGWIMSAFGLGSVVGTLIGGKLTDKIGYYKVMVGSLFVTGFLFIGLQFLTSFTEFCFGIFILMVVAEMFRPAMFVAMSAYSKPENKTRSVTLVRLAINLGFSAGPAIGGLIITTLGYNGLFWVDGITCILATFLLVKVLDPRKTKPLDEVKVENPVAIYRDKAFWIFFAAMTLFAIIFLQFLSTMPLYYTDIHHLTELEIGLLLSMNGLMIFFLEMPLIQWLENSKYSKIGLIVFGCILTAVGFLVLNMTSWIGILIISMILMTVGEMIALPFSNVFVIKLAKNGNLGQYMAMYIISFSIGHIVAHNVGLQMVDKLGFEMTWNIITILGGLCVLLLYILKKYLKVKKI